MKNLSGINTKITQLESKKKNTFVAYILWFFLMSHFLYLRKWVWQIIYWLCLPIAYLVMSNDSVNEVLATSIVIFILLFVFVYPLFGIPSMVNTYNMKIEKQILDLKDEKESLMKS